MLIRVPPGHGRWDRRKAARRNGALDSRPCALQGKGVWPRGRSTGGCALREGKALKRAVPVAPPPGWEAVRLTAEYKGSTRTADLMMTKRLKPVERDALTNGGPAQTSSWGGTPNSLKPRLQMIAHRRIHAKPSCNEADLSSALTETQHGDTREKSVSVWALLRAVRKAQRNQSRKLGNDNKPWRRGAQDAGRSPNASQGIAGPWPILSRGLLTDSQKPEPTPYPPGGSHRDDSPAARRSL